jgi:hypothetical protein
MIRYRVSSLRKGAEVFLPLLGGVIFAYIMIRGDGSSMSASEFRQGLEGAFLAAVVCGIIGPEDYIALTPEALVIHRFGKRVIEWREIADISVVNNFGIRSVVVRKANGKRVGLRVPVSLLDRRFDEKVRAMRAFWLGRREWTEVTR